MSFEHLFLIFALLPVILMVAVQVVLFFAVERRWSTKPRKGE